MATATETVFSLMIEMVRSPDIHLEDPEEIRKTLQKGASLLPVPSSLKTIVAEVWEVKPEQIEKLKDDDVIRLALKSLDDERIVRAMISHAKVIDAYFDHILSLAENELKN